MPKVLVQSYTEPGYEPIPSLRLSDDEYGRALQCFVGACTDAVPINIKERSMFLARRRSRPMTGWWLIGGKMMPDELKEQSMVRCFQRETKLELPPESFSLVAVFDYRWKNRQQEPQQIGCHMGGVLHLYRRTFSSTAPPG